MRLGKKNAFVWVILISKNVTRSSAPEKARAKLKLCQNRSEEKAARWQFTAFD